MPLEHAEPPYSLAIELREVARDANALIEGLIRGFNFPLPSEFPQGQLIDICKSLVQLPAGTAEGCRAPLDYARHRLPAIRREYILSEELSSRDDPAPALTRGESLDLRLGTLISSVTTALDEYRRLAAEEAFAEAKPDASVVPPEGTIHEATIEASNLDLNIANAQTAIEEVSRADSKPADNLKRQLRDARGLNRLAFAEIRMPRVVVSWLRKSVDALKDYPDLIRKTANGLRVGTDILRIGLERWHEIDRDLGRFVVDQLNRTWDAFDKVADRLETRSRKVGTIQLPDDFDLEAVRELILQGIAPPRHWWPFIVELHLANEVLRSLAALSGLSNLQRLDLRGTLVSDIAVLADLGNLRRLNLAHTPVRDVWAVVGLTRLRSLDLTGTHVRNLTPLAGLGNLQILDLARTPLRDIAVLAGLTNLRSLDLSGTEVSDLGPLAGLTNLRKLNLSGSRAMNLGVLARLASLQHLDLSDTRTSDLTALARLNNLQSLNIEGTRVSNITMMKRIRGLQIKGSEGARILKESRAFRRPKKHA